ncbi:ATP synthase gamma chain [Desulfovibrionales bacterium]
MPSLKDVLQKITAVKKTKQITKAMNMVASAKLRCAHQHIDRFRPYADKFDEILRDLSAKVEASVHPLFKIRREIKAVGIILVTSDRGLCGSFNNNLITTALNLAWTKQADGKVVKFYCIGKKGRDSVCKLTYELVKAFIDQVNNFDFTLANSISTDVISAYMAGELDEAIVIYSQFLSMSKQVPVIRSILPIAQYEAKIEVDENMSASAEYTYEPMVENLMAELLPRFIKAQIYRGMLDTSASEHAARMAAMDNATRACDDMIGFLTLLYNKTRQAEITRELMDIVGGAEALKG